MQSIQEIREIIEDKIEHFSDGEYLKLMNNLMNLSRFVHSDAEEPRVEEPVEMEVDQDYNDSNGGVYQLSPVYINELYDADVEDISFEVYSVTEVERTIQILFRMIEEERDYHFRSMLSFCVIAYIFKNFLYVVENRRFQYSLLDFMEAVILEMVDHAPDIYDQKRTILFSWLNILRSSLN